MKELSLGEITAHRQWRALSAALDELTYRAPAEEPAANVEAARFAAAIPKSVRSPFDPRRRLRADFSRPP